MANVASRVLEDLEGHQARTVFQGLLDCPVSAAWMDCQGLVFMTYTYLMPSQYNHYKKCVPEPGTALLPPCK